MKSKAGVFTTSLFQEGGSGNLLQGKEKENDKHFYKKTMWGNCGRSDKLGLGENQGTYSASKKKEPNQLYGPEMGD